MGKLSLIVLKGFVISMFLLPVLACGDLGLVICQTEHCFAFASR